MRFLANNWRRMLLVVAVLLFAGLAYSHRIELVRVKAVLGGGSWRLFLLALMLQLGFFLWQSAMFQQILRIWLPVRFRDILRVTLASNSVNKLVPSGGMSGLVLFMTQAKENGVDMGLSLLANMLFYILDYLSFLLLVWAGVFYYSQTMYMGHATLLAVTVFSIIIMLIAILLGIILKNSTKFGPWLEKLWTSIPFRRDYFMHQLPQLKSVLSLVENKTGRMGQPLSMAFLAGLAMQLTDVVILYLCFATIGYNANWGMVVAGFGLATVLTLVSMVPQGIGIYETAMTWIYVQMGIPFEIAVTVALLYRAVTFWFAIIPGLFTIRRKDA